MKHTARPPFLLLTADDVRRALPMTAAIDAMAEAFQALSAGTASVPLRLPVPMPEQNGNSLFMPVYHPGKKLMGIKIVTVNHENPKSGLPLIGATVLLYDAATGSLLAMMEGETLTAIRTGAGAGLATRLLAPEAATTAAIFGSGPQAATQAEAILAVRNISRLYVYGRDQDKTRAFCQDLGKRFSAEFIATTDLSHLRRADVICTATTATTPLFAPHHLKEKVLINAVGSYQPHVREIAGDIMAAAGIIVDQREAALAEAGELALARQEGKLAPDHPIVEIGELTAAKIQALKKKNLLVFKSVGNAIQDIVAGAVVLENAAKNRLGRSINL